MEMIGCLLVQSQMQTLGPKKAYIDFSPLHELENELYNQFVNQKPNILDEFEADPKSYRQTKRNKHLIVSQDKLTVRHEVLGIRHQSNASIQALYPLSQNSCVAYYEVKVLEVGNNGVVAVGLAKNNYPSNKQPGWMNNSYGYHGDDGKKFHNSGGPGIPYGPKFSKGDIVGCGVNFRTNEVFFTKNGRYLGVAFKNFNMECLYPTIGLDYAAVEVNFGSKKFKFNILGFEEEERRKELLEIENTQLDCNLVKKFVRDYLVKEGYSKTLAAFDKMNDSNTKKLDYALELRNEVRKNILDGNIEHAVNILEQNVEGFLERDEQSRMLLEYQYFIESVRNNNMQKAIEIAQTRLYNYFTKKNATQSIPSLDDVVGLLAYKNPLESPLKYLLDFSQREYVADKINSALLSFFGGKSIYHFGIERVIQQLLQVYKYNRLDVIKEFGLSNK